MLVGPVPPGRRPGVSTLARGLSTTSALSTELRCAPLSDGQRGGDDGAGGPTGGALGAARRAMAEADAAYARWDVEAVVAHLSAAVRGFTAADEPCAAAMACTRLGEAYASGLGNLTAGRAWFARAARLVADQPPCLEQGWAAVAPMGCDVDDPEALLAAAELALDRARRFGDLNLETKALADAGLAHVQAGRLAEGMALLDEAMALACGPADDAGVAAKSVCSFFTACYVAADFARADTWSGLLRSQGLIGPTPGGPLFLSSHCDSVAAALLVELGRWSEAEALLRRAKAEFEASMGPSWHPDIALADLHTLQGRLAEAEALLLGKDQSLQALLPAARLALARGDHELARAAARRGLRAIRADRLRAAELLAVVVDAELAGGRPEQAAEACADLLARTGDLPVAVLQARSAATHAHLLAARGEHDEAVARLEAAVDALGAGQLPWRRATLLVELAERREQAGDLVAARLDAASAAAALAALDVVVAPAQAAVLSRLAGPATAGAGHGPPARLEPGGRWWDVTHRSSTVRLADTKGLRYLAALLATPGVERHALDLVDGVEGIAAGGQGPDRRALGDAGELADARARTAYRRRVEALRAEVDEALAAGALERAEAGQAELDELVRELARAFGLGGRDRRAASAAERARLNVTRALRGAIARVAEALPEAGAALDRHVRTGTYCCYSPVGGELRWTATPASFTTR